MNVCQHTFSYSISSASQPVGDAEISAYVTLDGQQALTIVIHADSSIDDGVQAQALDLTLTGSLPNGQTYNTSLFKVTYIEKEAVPLVDDADKYIITTDQQNAPPYFTDEIKTLYVLDFHDIDDG